jgi:HEAT repeat protein
MGRDARGAAAALRAALKDPYSKVRFHVSYCLVQIDRGDKAAAQTFLEALPKSGMPKSYPVTRIGVLRTLGELAAREKAAVPVLRALLQDESDRVWVALADVLKKLNGTP